MASKALFWKLIILEFKDCYTLGNYNYLIKLQLHVQTMSGTLNRLPINLAACQDRLKSLRYPVKSLMVELTILDVWKNQVCQFRLLLFQKMNRLRSIFTINKTQFDSKKTLRLNHPPTKWGFITCFCHLFNITSKLTHFVIFNN